MALLAGAACLWSAPVSAQLVISGNENKIDLTKGDPKFISKAEPDSLSLIYFSAFPPRVQHVRGISNSVIGPPSNVAITPDGQLALVADSIAANPADAAKWVPAKTVHVLDLTQEPPSVIADVAVGAQPSGMSITPDGKMALVANRADGTVSILRIDGKTVTAAGAVEVCEPAEGASDVAISPDGRLALVSINKGGCLRVLAISETGDVKCTERTLSVFGMPYRCVITPDGELGVVAGGGQGMFPDTDALSIVDLRENPIRTIDYIPIGSGPESIEISPDGKLLVAVLMDGSNLAPDNPQRTDRGRLLVMARRGMKFERTESLPLDRIPEGVAFTSDGRYLVVQCHPSKQLWVFQVNDGRVIDTGHRITVPGFPSSLRAAPH